MEDYITELFIATWFIDLCPMTASFIAVLISSHLMVDNIKVTRIRKEALISRVSAKLGPILVCVVLQVMIIELTLQPIFKYWSNTSIT